MRWPRLLGVEPRHPGSYNAGRGVGILLASRVDTLNGQAALGQEVVMLPKSANVISRPLKRGIDMSTIRVLTLFVGATTAIASCPILLGAQSAPTASPADSVSIHISLQKTSYAIGEKPIAVLEIKNISSNEVCLSTNPYLERVHITRKDSEPPKTELHRHLLGDIRPGDGPALSPGPVICRPIAPGSLDSLKYDLTGYYDLGEPGDYSVYIEIYDPKGPKDGSGHWLRTNTARFDMAAPSQ
jgi:uncharacterized ParB-like nuclease family protein